MFERTVNSEKALPLRSTMASTESAAPPPPSAPSISATWRTYSASEQLANCLTHAIGCPITVYQSILLLRRIDPSSCPREFLAALAFELTVFLVYFTSTLYHGVTHKRLRAILQIGDHLAILLMIAGAYTFVGLVPLWRSCGVPLAVFVWALTAVGVVGKLFFWELFLRISLPYFLTLGWSGIFAAWAIFKAVSLLCVALIFASAAFYCLGCFFFQRDDPYDHTIWHVCVLLGGLSVQAAVFQCI
jgi:hemolysin III